MLSIVFVTLINVIYSKAKLGNVRKILELIILGLFFVVIPFLAIWMFSWRWIMRIIIPIGLLTWGAFYSLENSEGSGAGIVIIGTVLTFVLIGLGSGIVIKAVVDFIRWDNNNSKLNYEKREKATFDVLNQ